MCYYGQVILDNLGGLKLSLDFNALTATVVDTYTSESVLSRDQTLRVRRWSTPSYVEADSGAPLNLYTQWCWYQTSQSGKFQPFLPVGGTMGCLFNNIMYIYHVLINALSAHMIHMNLKQYFIHM